MKTSMVKHHSIVIFLFHFKILGIRWKDWRERKGFKRYDVWPLSFSIIVVLLWYDKFALNTLNNGMTWMSFIWNKCQPASTQPRIYEVCIGFPYPTSPCGLPSTPSTTPLQPKVSSYDYGEILKFWTKLWTRIYVII